MSLFQLDRIASLTNQVRRILTCSGALSASIPSRKVKLAGVPTSRGSSLAPKNAKWHSQKIKKEA